MAAKRAETLLHALQLAVLASLSSLSLLDAKHCDYGKLPGRWVKTTTEGWLNWELYDKDCPLRDLAAKHVAAAMQNVASASASAPATSSAPCKPGEQWSRSAAGMSCKPNAHPASAPAKVGILLMGDSAERILVKQLCLEWAGGQPVQRFDIQLATISGSTCNRDTWEHDDPNCCTCALPTLRVTKDAIWSLSRQPLAFNFHEERLGLAEERIEQGVELFKRENGGKLPDLILVQSALWELATLWKQDTQNGSREPSILSAWNLPPEWLQEYVDNISAVFSQLKELVNGTGTLIAWRTTAYPQLHATKTGWHKYLKLGQRSHLAELNSAARHSAARLGVPLVDLAAMMEVFFDNEHLSDDHHVKDWANYAYLNILLNLIAEAAESRRL